MTAILAFLKAKGVALLAGAGGAVAALVASKVVPNMVGKLAERYLERALDVRNPEDRELVLALVKWAEKKIPDAGAGKEKYALVAKKLVSLLPVMKKHEDRISRLIEDAVAKMDKELKEALEKK